MLKSGPRTMSKRLIKLKNYYAYLTNRKNGLLYPLHTAIEVTNHCNLHCIMCPHSRMTRAQGFISMPLFTKIIDEIKDNTELIYLHGMGEPLLHPDFFELATYAKQKKLLTAVSTNTTLLSEENSTRLIKSGIDFITLALDGMSKDTYEHIRVGGSFDDNLLRVKRFLKLKSKLKTDSYIELQFILMDTNKNERQQIRSLFTAEELSAIDAFRIKPLYLSPSINTQPISHKHPCYFLWNTCTITWDGKVSLCCMDYDAQVVLGDVNKETILKIWNAEKITTLRNLHKKLSYGNMPICNNCSLPEKRYFSPFTIMANAFLNAAFVRKVLPLFEKHFIINRARR